MTAKVTAYSMNTHANRCTKLHSTMALEAQCHFAKKRGRAVHSYGTIVIVLSNASQHLMADYAMLSLRNICIMESSSKLSFAKVDVTNGYFHPFLQYE